MNAFFRNKFNNIHFGKCATVPSVVKDKTTFDQIKGIRKCNILEMEAYYLALWHSIIKNSEKDKLDETSRFLILKSPSDNGISNTKALLEKVGSRQLAMTNLSLVTKYLIEEIIDFNNNETKTIPNLIEEFYSNKSTDSIALNYKDRGSFNRLCSYLITDKNIEDYFEYAKDILKREGAILTIYGPAGTGKSTFFTYLYNELKGENCCIYIDISKIIKYDDRQSIDICLYLIKRMLQTDSNKKIIILFDGFGKNIEAPSDFIIDTFNNISQIVSLIDNQKISFCVNDLYDDKKESVYLPEFFSNFLINFQNISINDKCFEDFIVSFYEYYRNVVNLPEDFSNKVIIKLKSSEIQCVDFRLLKAIADNYNAFKNSKSFHDFIKSYSIQTSVTTHNLINISKYMFDNYYTEVKTRSFEMSQIPTEFIAPYKKLSQNIYTNAYLLSMKIWDSCTSSNSEFDSYEFLISKNINSFLAYYIKSSNTRDANKKFQIVLTKVARNTISKSAAMQLMYIIGQSSIYRMLNQQNKRMFKELTEDRVKSIFEKNDNISYIEIMEQRTMSIIMCMCFNEDKYLREYNELMIKDINIDEINDYLNYNVAFHILYFSRETFPFSDIENTNVDQIDSNIIFYAYDSIAAFLRNTFNNINQLHVMNFITLLFIYKKHICCNEELSKYKDYCGNLLTEIFNVYKDKNIIYDDLTNFFGICID